MHIRAAQLLVLIISLTLASIATADTSAQCTGDALATYRGVPAYSNAPYQGGFDTCGPKGPDGWQYTCVEYVRRFYRVVFGIDTSAQNGWFGDAKDFYPAVDKRDLISFRNGATTVAPEPDDILVFDRSAKDSKGHVAIVTGVNGNKISLIDENYPVRFSPTVTLSQDPATGYWSIAPRQSLPVKGWLRPKRLVNSGPTFAPKSDRPTGPGPLGLVIADFDGDQQNDIAVSIYNFGFGDHITIFRNNGSTLGSLKFDVPVDVPTGSGPEGIAAGDLDHDGKIDLVVANASDLSISVLRNVSTKGFVDFKPVLPPLSIPGTPHRVVIADFDGDGMPDIIATSNSGRLVSVLHHGPDPNTISFDSVMNFPAGDYLNEVAVTDIDGDMMPDMLVPLTRADGFSIYKNQSTPGHVQAAVLPPFATGTFPQGIAVGDLNNDKLPDVLVTENGGIAVFQNQSTPGVFRLPRTDVTTGTNPAAVAIGDLDNDGFLDAVAANSSDNTLTVLHNATTATGAPIGLTALQATPATGLTPINVVLGDIDHDGLLDIVVVNQDGKSISIILNTTGHQ